MRGQSETEGKRMSVGIGFIRPAVKQRSLGSAQSKFRPWASVSPPPGTKAFKLLVRLAGGERELCLHF